MRETLTVTPSKDFPPIAVFAIIRDCKLRILSFMGKTRDVREKIPYWTWSKEEALRHLNSRIDGLSAQEVLERTKLYGLNRISGAKQTSLATLFWKQVSNPLIGILVFAVIVSALVREWIEASIIISIILLSAALGFLQEHRATRAIQLLLQRIAHTVTVRRGNQIQEVPAIEVIPGDIIFLNAGTMIPADGVLLESKDLYVNQAVLTGESMPAEKNCGVSNLNSNLSDQTNTVFAATSVRSGTAVMLAVTTGQQTHFGQISEKLDWRDSETDFERGLRQFGILLTRIMIVFVLFILIGNIWLDNPLIESLLFSIAIAVGLSPELLPAVLTVTLSKGAVRMAKQGVIVRRLNCIEALGNIEVLCCDKTGTLTEGRMTLKDAVDVSGKSSYHVLELGYFNSLLQTGIKNPLDEAIINSFKERHTLNSDVIKIDEIPYDFIRRRITVVVQTSKGPHSRTMITKGATKEILEICSNTNQSESDFSLHEKIKDWGAQGLRVLAVASRDVSGIATYSSKDEYDLILKGFLLFEDAPREDAKESLQALQKLGVAVKIITGDNQYVANSIAKHVGFEEIVTLTGAEIQSLTPDALLNQVEKTNIFAEVDPQQKENVVRALKKRNLIVGYMGDGINDAPALLASDVGISVESAVDVAKESADLVLTRHNLKHILTGITEGRKTFANTLKYIHITTSANFGNMLSMAFASLFLPFLPLVAKQILLNNLLSDIPALSIGNDEVDEDWSKTPHRWSLESVRKQMIGFGLISSFFDILTFLVLIYVLHASIKEFQTTWFVVSLLTEIFIIFVIRTYRPFFRSRPDRWILITSALAILILAFIVLTPIGSYFDFVPLSSNFLWVILVITILYLMTSELLKLHIVRPTQSSYSRT